MIKKISVQDVVSKRSSKDDLEEQPVRGRRNDEERDFLIERLTRKRVESSSPKIHLKSEDHTTHRKPKNKPTFGKKWIWMSVPLVIALVLFLVLQFFSGAVITITPKHLTVPINSTLIASIDATSSSITSSSSLMYQIITLTASGSQIAVATGTAVKTTPKKASGEIVVYNNYGAAAQTLVKNTRFESSSGLIYRTVSTISVPGAKNVGGKNVPGSITVKVIADQTGSTYNIDLTDFTIPGFKTDSARYAKIFGRSKTVMTGGTDGNSFGISDSDRLAAQTIIENNLRENLLKQVQVQKTVNSIIFNDASKISFQHLPDTTGTDLNHVVINEKGTISSIVFDKQVLGKVLLSDAIASVGNNAEIHGLDTLKFSPAVNTTSTLWQPKPFTFTLSGSVDVIGVVDSTKILNDVLGVSKSNLPNIFAKYPTIDKVNTEIKPLWQSSVPSDSTKVKIEIVK